MQKQKQNWIPTINGVPTTTFDASVDFTTDFIEFPESIPWAVMFDAWGGVTEGAPTFTILCSNVQDGDYIPYSADATDVNLTVAGSRIIYDSIFAPRFMKIDYTSGGSEGSFDLVISK